MDELDRYTLDYRTEEIGKAPVYTPVTFIVKEVPPMYKDDYVYNDCPLCSEPLDNRGHSRYVITSDGVLFPTVICHRDCVHKYHVNGAVAYTTIVDRLLYDYNKAIEYAAKYAHWFSNKAVIV